MSGFDIGEWHLLAGCGVARVATGPGSLTVATVHDNDGWDKYEVAKQIAKQHNAHDDLVAACKTALAEAEAHETMSESTLDALKAALAKARE